MILLLAMIGAIILTTGIGQKEVKIYDYYFKTRRGDTRLSYWKLKKFSN